jgi:hypothetical protein
MFGEFQPAFQEPGKMSVRIQVESSWAGLVRSLLRRHAQELDFAFVERAQTLTSVFTCTGTEAILSELKTRLSDDVEQLSQRLPPIQ